MSTTLERILDVALAVALGMLLAYGLVEYFTI